MSMPTHPTERLGELLDNRLEPSEAAAIRAHLEGCADCRRDLAWLAAGRDAGHAARHPGSAPDDLRARISAVLDDIDRGAAVAPPARPSRRVLWAGLAGAAAILAVAFMAGSWRVASADPVARAHAAYRSVSQDTSALALRTSDAVALERYLNARAAGPSIRVIDLGMMGWTLVGGTRLEDEDVPVAMYTYRSASGADLVCQMYVGVLDDLPPPDEVRRAKGFEFRVYTRDGTTLVFWQEGELVCVLAADLPAAEVLALAVAKAMTPV